MPYLSKKRVWTQQPQVAVEIDWSNPLSKDLSAAFVFSNGLCDLVTGKFAENKGGIFVNSSLGKCFQAITAGINLPWDLNFTDNNVTVTVVEYRTGSPSSYWMIADARQGLSPGYIYGNGASWLEPNAGTFTTPGYKVTSVCKDEVYQNAIKTSVTNTSGFTPRAELRLLARFTDNDPYNNGVVAAIYIHKRNITQGEATSLYEQPWRLLKKQDRRIWIPSSGGGVHTTTSILTSDVATISGTSLHKILHTVVGNLTSSAATLTGTSVHTTPSPTHNTVGVLSASNSSITGIAARYREHQTTGILTTTNATINGTTNNFSVITSTGVLSSDVATLAGVMSITPAPGIHISTGVLQSNSSTITGILTHIATGHTLTGTLVSSVATLNGNVAHNIIHSSSGTLVSSVATINGTTSSSGVITLTPADIEAIANAVWQHPWALTLPKWLALK